MWVSGKKQLLSCAGDRHIKFSVYYIFIFLKSIGRQEIQLTEILYGKRIDDYITLASLIAFYRINGNMGQFRDSFSGNLSAYHRYLISVRDNHPHSLVGVKSAGSHPVNTFEQSGDNSCFINVRFLRISEIVGSICGDKHHTAALY